MRSINDISRDRSREQYLSPEAIAERTAERMRESAIAFACQNIRDGIENGDSVQERHYRAEYLRLTGEEWRV